MTPLGDAAAVALAVLSLEAAVLAALHHRAAPPLELLRCERCGRPTSDPLYHARRCAGRPKEQRVASYVPRRW